MVVIDAVIRLVPGVLGDEREQAAGFVFGRRSGCWSLAQYTRPREYRGLEVPEILLSGDHEEIARWRKHESLERTPAERRADC